jgi:uncharacterized protein (TIGR03067 family)
MASDYSKSDNILESLQGRWRVVYSEVDGEMTPVDEFSTIVIENKDNRFAVEKNGTIVHEGKYSVNVSVTPHEIVYIYSKGADVFLGGPRAGIFQLEGETFKTCLGAVGQRPPSGFNTFPDSDAVLTIQQRVGSEGGKGLSVARSRQISQW